MAKQSMIKMPHHDKINSRIGALKNAFVHGLLPVNKPSEEQFLKAVAKLDMTKDTLRCAYCGGPYETLDHFHSIVSEGKPTWYIDELTNFIPCCNSCNSSKGGYERNGKDWEQWMRDKKKDLPDLEKRIKDIKRYIGVMKPQRHIDLEKAVDKETWDLYWDNQKKIIGLVNTANDLQAKMKEDIEAYIEYQRTTKST